ncbi:MAG TPA: hypothetical protein PKK43_14095 [Spirochaetota bacterium]|nr:hypothetical protein [Spirochaetota bacterium]
MKHLFRLFIPVITLTVFAVAISYAGNPAHDVVNSVTYRHKGTRSESRSGSLTIDGIKIPDTFTYVLCDGKMFRFYQRTQRWGKDGYFPSDEPVSSVFPDATSNPDAASADKGWRDVKGRSDSVPAHWIYVRWDGGMVAVEVSHIGEFVKTRNIKPISRMTSPSFKK